jgi:hypothetical protein
MFCDRLWTLLCSSSKVWIIFLALCLQFHFVVQYQIPLQW